MKKKTVAALLCAVFAISLAGCVRSNGCEETSNTGYEEGRNAGYKEGYHIGYEEGRNAGYKEGCNTGYEEGCKVGYEEGYSAGRQEGNVVARFSGSFTATVEKLLPDYYALPGNTVAVVHFFQDGPFLLLFQEDMTGKLMEGTTYVFDFEPFEVEVPAGKERIDIMDYMYSIKVTNYRPAEEDEVGLEEKKAAVERMSK